MRTRLVWVNICLTLCISYVAAKGDGEVAKTKKMLPKDPLFISEMDLENLYDQWEDSDEDVLPVDELPLHKRPKPILMGGIDDHLLNDPDKMMKLAKKGQPLMTFVTVAGNPTKEEAEMLTQRWQVGLTNMHLKCERFMVADDRAIFMFEDGSLAFDAKDYLLDQAELKDYTIDNRVFHGKSYPVEYLNAPKSDDEKESLDKVTTGGGASSKQQQTNAKEEL